MNKKPPKHPLYIAKIIKLQTRKFDKICVKPTKTLASSMCC